jgi:hypothetical protein
MVSAGRAVSEQNMVRCSVCAGTGICGNCHGSGIDQTDAGSELGIPCLQCHGTKQCHACSGNGQVPRGTYEPGQRITVPNPDNPGIRLSATYLEVAVNEPATISDPRVVGGTRKVDQARIRYDDGDRDGTVGLVPFSDIERVS